jgi:hypothetical protein
MSRTCVSVCCCTLVNAVVKSFYCLCRTTAQCESTARRRSGTGARKAMFLAHAENCFLLFGPNSKITNTRAALRDSSYYRVP